jgi:hypothetical protein
MTSPDLRMRGGDVRWPMVLHPISDSLAWSILRTLIRMLAAMIKQCCLAGSQGDVRHSFNYEHSTL